MSFPIRSFASTSVTLVSLILCGCPTQQTPPPPSTAPASTSPAPTESPTPSPPSPDQAPTTPSQQVTALPNYPILSEQLRQLRNEAQLAVLGNWGQPGSELLPLPQGPLPGKNFPRQLTPGYFSTLEFPDGANSPYPLAAFEQALTQLESGTRSKPVRIAVFGSSSIAADLWTGYLRRYLQLRFGNGGPGFVSAAKPKPWYRHQEFHIENSSKGRRSWTKHNSYNMIGEDDPGHFGVMGQAMSASTRGSWADIRPGKFALDFHKNRFFEIHHLLQPNGGSYRVFQKGKVIAEVDTALPKGEKQVRLGVKHIELPQSSSAEPFASLRIEITSHKKEVRLLGVIAETGEPGIVLDTYGITGAKVSNQRFWNPELWADELKFRDPSLYAFYYGNNESTEEEVPLSVFKQDFRDMLHRFRSTLPNASCLIIGPGDFPKKASDENKKLKILPRPRLNEIREVERQFANEFGCAFLDLLKMVGGEGAQMHWVDQELAKQDFLHFTRRGYARLAVGIGDAIMQSYDARQHVEPSDNPADSQQPHLRSQLEADRDFAELGNLLNSASQASIDGFKDRLKKQEPKKRSRKKSKQSLELKLPSAWPFESSISNSSIDAFQRFRYAKKELSLAWVSLKNTKTNNEHEQELDVELAVLILPDGRLRWLDSPAQSSSANIPPDRNSFESLSPNSPLQNLLSNSASMLLDKLSGSDCPSLPAASAELINALPSGLDAAFSPADATLRKICSKLKGLQAKPPTQEWSLQLKKLNVFLRAGKRQARIETQFIYKNGELRLQAPHLTELK